MSNNIELFHDLLAKIEEEGGFSTDDVLAAILPLMYQTQQVHQLNLAAPLNGIDHLTVKNGELHFSDSDTSPFKMNMNRVREIQDASRLPGALNVVDSVRISADINDATLEVSSLNILNTDEDITRPFYIPGYHSWEERINHHDVLTDIFSIGMLMASLACALDFTIQDDFTRFVHSRKEFHNLAPSLHPVVATIITRMTDLNRHNRPQDLSTVIKRLENYRDQNFETPLDFSADTQFRQASRHGKREIILNHLRERLFEISRRNRLIYFHSTMQSVDLTEGSIPLMLDYKNIKAQQLFYYHTELANDFAKCKEINLGKYLCFEDSPYLPSMLDRIKQESVRDSKEFGFSQLRIALVFLRWHNLKENVEERIHSPLLLLPVQLQKKKGIRDSYLVQPITAVAEVNPALRHYLKELYNLDLPEEVNLENPKNMDAFFNFLTAQIAASEPAITLNKIDQPQIKLIYESAHQRLNAFRRRMRLSGRSLGNYGKNQDYSYSRESYKPLGIQIFNQKVRPTPSPFDNIMRQQPQLRNPFIVEADHPTINPESVKSKESYTMQTGSVENPYVWDFDLCHTTLGNFNYRKMTLVRDYTRLLETDDENAAFDAVFSLLPQEKFSGNIPELSSQELNLIVPGDPTQISAVAHARSGRCYIIQGPPGTGKSQTITNLIADYVARGQRVLFVCEKRAAIDVVFYRLRQQGLDKLAVLIHDSQTDKKEFVNDLRVGYENVEQYTCESNTTEEHAAALSEIDRELGILKYFSQTMSTVDSQAGIELRKLLHRLVELRESIRELTIQAQEILPQYHMWNEYGTIVHRLIETLRDIGEPPIFAQHPLRHIMESVIQSDNPLTMVQQLIADANTSLNKVLTTMKNCGLSLEQWNSLDALLSLANYVGSVRELAENGQLKLTQTDDTGTKEYDKLCREYALGIKKLEKARTATKNWQTKLSSADTSLALAQAHNLEKNILRFLNPAWYQLKKVIESHYNFSKHAVKPPFVKILTDLNTEYNAEQAVQSTEELFGVNYNVNDAAVFQTMVATARETVAIASPIIRKMHNDLLQNQSHQQIFQLLTTLQGDVESLSKILGSFFSDYTNYTLLQLQKEMAGLESCLAHLNDLYADLSALCDVPEQLSKALRTLPLDDIEFEACIGMKTLNDAYRKDRVLQRFDTRTLLRHIQNLNTAYQRWMNLNGKIIVSKICTQVQEHIRVSSLPVSQLTPEQKIFKQRYARGRRELEHEFGKTMRFKSIRDLVEAESGDVVFDLKPIWLMSPLSVADTLPLDTSRFDVVIFDEASQIRLEEAVPAIFRAKQIIVVGDEMQLPPSNFFSAARGDEESLLVEDQGDMVEYDLNADSLLSHATQNLPSTLLGWHYRSREEALISFSNNAFYRGELLTVPDCMLPVENNYEINIKEIDDVQENVKLLLQRGISFHYMETAVYEKRRNVMEAKYIAHMVRELLMKNIGQSIGIVAFSQAQQDEIESALDDLGNEDLKFKNLLEAEMDREEDGQFCGLFIKNLENVQGDERDIIIMSICYGHDKNGKMLMNFGPINQNGGEKRLNVIFSRARRHMVVVSSIHHHDITNEYNDGANCLRNYLEYSAAISRGDQATARRVLDTLSPTRYKEKVKNGNDAVITEIRQELQKRGYIVDIEVGQSKFRCDLAVRLPDKSAYQLAILVDTDNFYANTNLLERYLLRPGILTSFGWQVTQVLSKDWFHTKEDVINRLERLLQQKNEETAVEPDDDIIDIPAQAEAIAEKIEIENIAANNDLPEIEQVKATETESIKPVVEQPIDSGDILLTRYLEFHDEKSSKFWEATVQQTRYTAHYGRIGTIGQKQIKDFSTPELAMQEAEKMIREKLAKGYKEAEKNG
jgi:predicted DNA-binding WGR domain protein